MNSLVAHISSSVKKGLSEALRVESATKVLLRAAGTLLDMVERVAALRLEL